MNLAVSRNSRLALASGALVAGKYRVERTLAEGGMGVVVAATDLLYRRSVALKLLRGGVGSQRDVVSRFSSEALAVAKLQSEHVGRVLDAGATNDGTLYLVREYFEGDSLARKLRSEGPFDVATAADYAIQACEGLAEAHSKAIVHCDIKPYNLFLVERSPGLGRIKIVDFGVSKFAFGDASNIVTSMIIGYMSPEQLRSASAVDHRSDVWSLGATLYELLTGQAAFDATQTLPRLVTAILDRPAPSADDLQWDVPAELAALVARCLAKEPGARFQSMGELAMALLPFAPEAARATAQRAASMTPALREVASTPAPLRERAATTADEPARGAEGEAAVQRRPNGPSIAPVTRTLFGVGEPNIPRDSSPPTGFATRTLFGLGEPRVSKNQGPSPLPRTRTLFGLGDAPTPLPPTTLAPRSPERPDADVMPELPRHRAPKWLGIATMSAAVVAVFLAILFAAPDGNDKGGAAARPRPRAVAVGASAHADEPAIAPAPVAQDVVELVVRASPPSAQITVDGALLDGNPARSLFPKGGDIHRVMASADGYESMTEDVSTSANAIVNLSLSRRLGDVLRVVKPAPVVPSVTAPSPAPANAGTVELPKEHFAPRPIETRDPYRVP